MKKNMLLLIYMVMRVAVIAVIARSMYFLDNARILHSRIFTSTEYCLYFYILNNDEKPGDECMKFTFN